MKTAFCFILLSFFVLHSEDQIGENPALQKVFDPSVAAAPAADPDKWFSMEKMKYSLNIGPLTQYRITSGAQASPDPILVVENNIGFSNAKIGSVNLGDFLIDLWNSTDLQSLKGRTKEYSQNSANEFDLGIGWGRIREARSG